MTRHWSEIVVEPPANFEPFNSGGYAARLAFDRELEDRAVKALEEYKDNEACFEVFFDEEENPETPEWEAKNIDWTGFPESHRPRCGDDRKVRFV